MKPAKPTNGPITTALMEGLELRKKLIADGTTPLEADYIVGQGLKAVLSNQREAPWRFYCEQCRDTGWINCDPSPEEYARLVRMYGEHPQSQGYVTKCEPCKWQQIQREKRRQQLGQGDEDDFAAAGQSKKSTRRFTKFGG